MRLEAWQCSSEAKKASMCYPSGARIPVTKFAKKRCSREIEIEKEASVKPSSSTH